DGSQLTPGYHAVLQQRLNRMVAGVRCGSTDRYRILNLLHAYPAVYDHTDIICADVNTGVVSATQSYVIPDYATCGSQYPVYSASCIANLPGQYYVHAIQDTLRRQVLAQMPIFEVQSIIDALYLLTHPGADLAQSMGRIPLASNPGLCLDVQWGNPASGT